MSAPAVQPSAQEMAELLKNSAECLDCTAPECYEATPGGVEACAALPFWNGRPVTRSMLLEWQACLLASTNGHALK